MKQKRILLFCLALALLLTLLPSCGGKIDAEGSALVVVASPDGSAATEYQVDLSALNGQRGLTTVLEYLRDHRDLSFTLQSGSFGAYLTSVGNLKAEGNSYIYLYTTVEADMDVSEMADTMIYHGTTLHSSGVGADAMTIEDGSILYICLCSF